jgi:putative Mg2+ transporter-C (MgtC) family protein
MPLTLGWREIALRLALSLIAGVLIGLDRGERGRPAGLRTTLLVCLAASVTMIQANLLLGTSGKPANSFVTLDLMRLPLGILTGMGFIGGGAILRRDGLVLGVTTAATLWFVTAIGLCFGSGQMALGLAALALGMVVLSGLRFVEQSMSQERTANLVLVSAADTPPEEEGSLGSAGYRIKSSALVFAKTTNCRTLKFTVQWQGKPADTHIPTFLTQFANHPDVRELEWNP